MWETKCTNWEIPTPAVDHIPTLVDPKIGSLVPTINVSRSAILLSIDIGGVVLTRSIETFISLVGCPYSLAESA